MVKPAPRTIRITPDVWNALASRAEAFETPNEVLRRLLGVGNQPPMGSNRAGGRGDHPMTARDAAALVLEEEGRGMTAKELYEAMSKRGYWHSDGSTPAQTIAADIYTSIQRDGEASRFVKVRRGVFALRSNP